MLVLGMLGAAAAQNQVQGALQGQNNGQPIHIEAMTLEIRDKDKTATFSGNVKVVQGDTTMRCRTLVVFYGPEEGAGATKAAAPTSTESQAAPGMPQGGNIRRAETRGDVTVVSKPPSRSRMPTGSGTARETSSGSGYAVEVASERSAADVDAVFRSLQAKFPNQLGGREPIVRRTVLGPEGIYYRALIGPFASMKAAAGVCNSLKAAGESCLVAKN
jgi:hypothetical protein